MSDNVILLPTRGTRPEEVNDQLYNDICDLLDKYAHRMSTAAAVGVLHIMAHDLIRVNTDAD